MNNLLMYVALRLNIKIENMYTNVLARCIIAHCIKGFTNVFDWFDASFFLAQSGNKYV